MWPSNYIFIISIYTKLATCDAAISERLNYKYNFVKLQIAQLEIDLENF